MTPKKRVIAFWVSIAVIVFVILFFIVESGKAENAREEAFERDVTSSFEVYGDAIDHLYFNGSYAAVYVRKDRWMATSEDRQQEVIKEMYSLIHVSAKKYNIKNGLFSLYTSDGNRIALYDLK